MKLLLSTSNKGKLVELQKVLGESYELLLKSDFNLEDYDVVEDGETLRENAYIKAKALFDKVGVNVIADDTGLFVEALDFAPGVYTARYAGEKATYEDNNKKLLGELKDIKKLKDRKAYFKTVICLITENGEVHYVEGQLDGYIAFELKGTNGFGYDPVFLISEDKSLAEITIEEKNKISHRGRALQELKKVLANL